MFQMLLVWVRGVKPAFFFFFLNVWKNAKCHKLCSCYLWQPAETVSEIREHCKMRLGGKKVPRVLLKWTYFCNSNWEFVLYSGWDICVFYNCVSGEISFGVSVHICTRHVQAAALAEDKTVVIAWIFWFSFFLERSYAIAKSVKVVFNLSGCYW